MTVAIPPTATAGQFFSLMDQGQQMNNGTDNGFGGALTFLNVRADNLPTVDSLAAVAGVSTPAPVTVGNPLVDRAYATDFPTPIGTPGPVARALTASALLVAGTLESFETWNQQTAGGSPTPSAGGLAARLRAASHAHPERVRRHIRQRRAHDPGTRQWDLGGCGLPDHRCPS